MKRKAFILTEILIGMTLQAWFAVILCGAFYMILNFSTSFQQGFAAEDKGQIVIAYFDSRIRNAGLGMWGCNGSKDIRAAFSDISALADDKTLCLPVAIVNSADGKVNVSRDTSGRFYSGNMVTLLYAHKDPNDVRLILCTDKKQSSIDVTNSSLSSNNKFNLIDKGKKGSQSYSDSEFGKAKEGRTYNIKHYAVIERSGVPVYTEAISPQVRLQASPSKSPVTVYPMSELLNIECQKLYIKQDTNGYNFVFQELNSSGKWDRPYYHTKDILELYMTLDTKPAVPIFELRVLVSEGLNEYGSTPKPKDWPGRWKNTGFDQYKVHVSKAVWKLYNLIPQFN